MRTIEGKINSNSKFQICRRSAHLSWKSHWKSEDKDHQSDRSSHTRIHFNVVPVSDQLFAVGIKISLNLLERLWWLRYYFNRPLFEMLDHRFQKLLWNFASIANVINPFLYAIYNYGPSIGCVRSSNSERRENDEDASEKIDKVRSTLSLGNQQVLLQ